MKCTMKKIAVAIVFAAYLVFQVSSEYQPCVPRDFGEDSTVCVCNATYCDYIGEVNADDLQPGTYFRFISSQDGKRFEKEIRSITSDKVAANVNNTVFVNLDRQVTYQTIMGFGGAFTDATGETLLTLSPAAQDNLLKSYFTKDGIEYVFGRIPIGGSDFSSRPYTYDDDHEGDFNLTYWSLQDEDLNYKIPIIHRAMAMSPEPILFFAAPWSAPTWMKTNNDFIGQGSLIGEPGGPYYKTWANYFIKFLDAYKEHGIELWGLTPQNEPLDGLIPNFTFNCMGLTAEMERDFIRLDLGPALEKAGYGNITLMILDDQRSLLPGWIETVLNDTETEKYVSGIALHWYSNLYFPVEVVNITHERFPDKFLLATEACEGWLFFERDVILGSWQRAESYAHDIMQDLHNWVAGWVDWNMCLDMTGGPNWALNNVDSPIIINPQADEFYHQPMYYALGHYSKFIRPGFQRIELRGDEFPSQTNAIAFKGTDGSIVIVILNRSDEAFSFILAEDNLTGTVQEEVAPHSIQTLILRI